jgi:hypothetical protein
LKIQLKKLSGRRRRRKEMQSYRLELIQKEFPFVNMLNINLKLVDRIQIERGDKNLLFKKGYEDSYSSSCCEGYCDYNKFFAVLTKGSKVIKLSGAGRSRTGSGEDRQWDANPIGEQLFTLKVIPDYIVEIVLHDTDSNGNGQRTILITIYKMKKFDMISFHQNEIQKAADQLKTEIEKVCS